jgi:ankyrin repeat protein
VEVGRLLLARGADPAIINHKGSVPLHTLCYGSDPALHSLAFAALLIAALKEGGRGVDLKDKRGFTPLLVCCTSGRLDIIQLLLKEGASLASTNQRSEGAREIAEYYGHFKIVQFIDQINPINPK